MAKKEKYSFHLIAFKGNEKVGEAYYEDEKLPAILLGKGVYKEIINYLNERIGTHYQVCSSTKGYIDARLHELRSLDDFKKVIDNKAEDWLNDSKMAKYLRPKTLFGTNFDSYLNEIHAKPKSTPHSISRAPTYDLEKIKRDAHNNTEIKY